ncbi:MAG: STAS domain-containing protein [Planctomycetes bacterium]|nr:STAS domain-containing protein [Planctomycetota bacterium]
MAEFTHEFIDDVLLVRITGKFDFGIYEDLLNLFDRELRGRGRPVVLNLARVAGITSSGISVLAKLSMEQDLKVAAPPREVRDLLELSGVSTILDLRDDEEAALRELRGRR